MKLGDSSILDVLTGQAAATATQSAIQTASATPFNVTISVDPETENWISVMLIGLVAAFIFTRPGKPARRRTRK